MRSVCGEAAASGTVWGMGVVVTRYAGAVGGAVWATGRGWCGVAAML